MWFLKKNLIGKQAPLITGEHWFNAEVLSVAARDALAKRHSLDVSAHLAGSIVLINFWDYTCIGCLHALPYLNQWWQLYKDKGFFVIGVHSPEFAFAKDVSKVQSAVMRSHLSYPVVSDPDGITWSRYKNTGLPRDVLCDRLGVIRYDYKEEGEYELKKHHIEELLALPR